MFQLSEKPRQALSELGKKQINRPSDSLRQSLSPYIEYYFNLSRVGFYLIFNYPGVNLYGNFDLAAGGGCIPHTLPTHMHIGFSKSHNRSISRRAAHLTPTALDLLLLMHLSYGSFINCLI